MKKSIILAFISTFVVTLVVDVLWHTVIFLGFYNPALHSVAYLGPSDVIAPLIPYLIVGDIVMSVLFVYFIPQMGGDNSKGTLAMRGAALGFLTTFHFATISHAIVNGFPASIMVADGIYGIVIGIIVSFIVGYFFRKAVAQKSAGM